jgi:hypothetical protein
MYPGQSLTISLDDNRDELMYVDSKPVENAALGLSEAQTTYNREMLHLRQH